MQRRPLCECLSLLKFPREHRPGKKYPGGDERRSPGPHCQCRNVRCGTFELWKRRDVTKRRRSEIASLRLNFGQVPKVTSHVDINYDHYNSGSSCQVTQTLQFYFFFILNFYSPWLNSQPSFYHRTHKPVLFLRTCPEMPSGFEKWTTTYLKRETKTKRQNKSHLKWVTTYCIHFIHNELWVGTVRLVKTLPKNLHYATPSFSLPETPAK